MPSLKNLAWHGDASKNKKYLDTDLPLAALASLAGCSSQTPMNPNQGNVYNEGDRVCYTYQGGDYMIKLLEDVKPDQMTVMATLPDGKRVMANTDWISDASNCARGSR